MAHPSKRSSNVCAVCGRSFTRRADLTRHMKQHDPNKHLLMHRCQWGDCIYATLQRSNLHTHLATHTGIKDKRCPEYTLEKDGHLKRCPFSTSDPGCLTRHRKRSHNYEPKGRPNEDDEDFEIAAMPDKRRKQSKRGKDQSSARYSPYAAPGLMPSTSQSTSSSMSSDNLPEIGDDAYEEWAANVSQSTSSFDGKASRDSQPYGPMVADGTEGSHGEVAGMGSGIGFAGYFGMHLGSGRGLQSLDNGLLPQNGLPMSAPQSGDQLAMGNINFGSPSNFFRAPYFAPPLEQSVSGSSSSSMLPPESGFEQSDATWYPQPPNHILGFQPSGSGTDNLGAPGPLPMNIAMNPILTGCFAYPMSPYQRAQYYENGILPQAGPSTLHGFPPQHFGQPIGMQWPGTVPSMPMGQSVFNPNTVQELRSPKKKSRQRKTQHRRSSD